MKRIQVTGLQGFTLIDLSVSLLLGTIVISLGGTALSSIVSANRSSNSQQTIQREASQSLEFIVAEARQAQSFIFDPTAITSLITSPSTFLTAVSPLSGAKEPVFVFNIALNGALSSEPIVYFLAPATTPWQGTALYRWGPPFDANGEYQNTPPNTWEARLLVDQVFEGTTTPNCNGWTLVPQGTPKGFYACVENPEGRIAEFVFQSEVISNMELKAKAFARSHNP